jgi:dipeptide/tripeptide permease
MRKRYGSLLSDAMDAGLTQAQADALVAKQIAKDDAEREARSSGKYNGRTVVHFIAPPKSGVVSVKYYHEGSESTGTGELRTIVKVGNAPQVGEEVAYSTEQRGIEVRKVLAIYHTYAQLGGVFSTVILARREGPNA